MSANTLIDIDVLSADGREYKTRYSYAGIAEAMRSINNFAQEGRWRQWTGQHHP